MRATLSCQWVTCTNPDRIIPFDKRIGLNGPLSRDIPANRDDEVLEHPISFKSKDALQVLQHILKLELCPMSWKDLYDAVHTTITCLNTQFLVRLCCSI